MQESAALVMRLAVLVFSSPIAMWKLQNEFREPRCRTRCWGRRLRQRTIEESLDASGGNLRLACAPLLLRWSALCLNRHPNPAFPGPARTPPFRPIRRPGRERKECGTVLGREMSIDRGRFGTNSQRLVHLGSFRRLAWDRGHHLSSTVTGSATVEPPERSDGVRRGGRAKQKREVDTSV